MSSTPRSSSEPGAVPAPRDTSASSLDRPALGAEVEITQVVVDLATGATGATGIALFDVDLTRGVLRWDQRLAEMFGAGEGLDHTWYTFAQRIHPHDRPRVMTAVEEVIATGGTASLELRVVLPDGLVRWVSARGRALCNAGGTTVRLVGAAYDVTSALPEASGGDQIVDSRSVGPDAESARRAAEQAQITAARQLSGLAQAALALADAVTVEDLSTIVAEQGLTALGADGGAVAVPDPADPAVLLSYITSSFGDGARADYSRLSLDTPLPVCVAATSGQRVLLDGEAASLAFSPLMEAVNTTTGCQAWASVPLRAGTQTLGVLTAGWAEPQTFTTEQVALLEAFAAQCAQALQRLQALAAERAAAAEIRSMAEALQRSLLTALPEPDHLEITARYAPTATGAQIGGDWYDVFLVPDGATSLVIGDVTGHDRDAAVAMAGVRNVLRGIAHALPHPPAAILSALDQAMGDLSITALTTAILAKIEQAPADAGSGLRRLHWSNAGHLPPLLVHPDGHAELLETPSDLLLGLDPTSVRHDHIHTLVPGTSLLLYTDGLVERRGESLQVGIERLRVTAQRLASVSPAPTLDAWCDALIRELATHADDDVALLALRTHPEDLPRPRNAGPEAMPADLARDPD